MGGLLGDFTVRFLGKALDLLNLRQRVLAQNLANAETPGYRRMDVDFRRALLQAMEDPEGWGNKTGGPQVFLVQENRLSRLDGNGVDVDQELVELTENALLFQSVTAALRVKFAMLRAAITEGRR
ncbi:MAG: flagellar basal body rod protein FlgB [Armatimonadota bacterium]|nr:flagellar basal body rod protein FlgB [Armatimonadota bacterium]MDR5702673.1 flagellar basal body rod protein FlgB [Armatimonadota bacterium]